MVSLINDNRNPLLCIKDTCKVTLPRHAKDRFLTKVFCHYDGLFTGVESDQRDARDHPLSYHLMKSVESDHRDTRDQSLSWPRHDEDCDWPCSICDLSLSWPCQMNGITSEIDAISVYPFQPIPTNEAQYMTS